MQLGRARPAIDAGETSALAFARSMLGDQAAALSCLAERLDEQFLQASSMILAARGRLVVSGLGKSGLIGRKIAATFSSTGTPALFVHLGEALHGDLGAMTTGDVALLVSHSGETPELLPHIHFIGQLGVPLIGISSNPRWQPR